MRESRYNVWVERDGSNYVYNGVSGGLLRMSPHERGAVGRVLSKPGARDCSARLVMKRIDYFSIWLLIAGTFTAIHGIMFDGTWRRGVLIFIWSYVAVGVLLQALWFRADARDGGPEPDFRAFTQLDVLNVVRRLLGET